MRITTYGELAWDESQQRYVVAYSEGHDYEGPIAQCFGSDSTMKTEVPELTPEQRKQAGIAADVGEQQLSAMKEYAPLRSLLFDQIPGLSSAIGGDLGLPGYDSSTPGFSLGDQNLVNSTISDQYNLGANDIDTALHSGLQSLKDVLAPSRGLRSYDTPILDRGNIMANTALMQKSQLGLGLRSTATQNLLNISNQARQNRMQLLSFLGNQGLGLGSNIGFPNLGASNSNTTTGATLGQYGQLASGLGAAYNAFGSGTAGTAGTAAATSGSSSLGSFGVSSYAADAGAGYGLSDIGSGLATAAL